MLTRHILSCTSCISWFHPSPPLRAQATSQPETFTTHSFTFCTSMIILPRELRMNSLSDFTATQRTSNHLMRSCDSPPIRALRPCWRHIHRRFSFFRLPCSPIVSKASTLWHPPKLLLTHYTFSFNFPAAVLIGLSITLKSKSRSTPERSKHEDRDSVGPPFLTVT